MIKKTMLILSVIISQITIVYGQKSNVTKEAHLGLPKSNELFKEIFKLDSIFFNAFNQCDTVVYRQYISDDLEFYHDLGGVHYLDKEMQSVREKCSRDIQMTRKLVKNSLEVYPLGSYGALEIGVHRFYEKKPNEKEYPIGTYKFLHVWQKKGDKWKITRVISYDHPGIKN
ncbi:nuclear transport factor 2 family protein [Chryseobacterium sp. Tr-659]|uniref:nuclear transport factor 2 family protein n=1 Tax=Chryseobacterium sp. Tr-659 TaxID=2608340 RepID=UPI00141DAE50|nr:nuclear transport factor 2 family protein [Chryseobacterium sp. Tr-659]